MPSLVRVSSYIREGKRVTSHTRKVVAGFSPPRFKQSRGSGVRSAPKRKTAPKPHQSAGQRLDAAQRRADKAFAKVVSGEVTGEAPYVPRGKTDEESYDYTDVPEQLAMKFDRGRLVEALNEDGMLKFDYEEYVPKPAIRAALKHMDEDERRRRRRGF